MKRILLCVLAMLLLAAPAGAQVWEWDASFDPTDPNAGLNAVHGTYWVERGGIPFDTGSLVNLGGGDELDWIWAATPAEGENRLTLDTRPRSSFAQNTTIDLLWRAIGTPGAYDNMLFMYPEGWTENHATFTARLVLDGEGQNLLLGGTLDGGNVSIPITGTDFVWTTFDIDIAASTITVNIDGQYNSTYSYMGGDPPGWGPDNFLTILGGPMELAYARVQVVPEPATLMIIASGIAGLLISRRRKRN